MMSISSDDPEYLHAIRDWSLVLISALFLPASLSLILFTRVLLAFRSNVFYRQRTAQPGTPRAKVLVTGVGMEKGLFLARLLYQGGCTIIGADFEPHNIPVCGRYSRALHRFYRLEDPKGGTSEAGYIDQIIQIVREEDIDLWISCSGVSTAMEDAQLMERLEAETRCRAFQFNTKYTARLDSKFEFMKLTQELGLEYPCWYGLQSEQDVGAVMAKILADDQERVRKQFIIKNAGMDDKSRGSLPLVSTADEKHMRGVLQSLDFSPGACWIMQELIEGGEEFCTHSIIIDGRVRAFTASPSASVLLHYTQVDPREPLFRAMLHFTEDFAMRIYRQANCFTGHLSFDFLVQSRATRSGVEKTIKPIECNPRCHTATVLFRGLEKEVTDTYLCVLPDASSRTPLVIPHLPSQVDGYFWVAHDLITLLLWPVAQVPLGSIPLRALLRDIREFCTHVLFWKDPTFEWWDPIPFLALNHVYWPLRLAFARIHGLRWKQLNVSTTKMFLT